MTNDRCPSGLSLRLTEQLKNQVQIWNQGDRDANVLIRQVEGYWAEIQVASATKLLLDHELAGKIRGSLIKALHGWDDFATEYHAWIAAAAIYFIQSDDDEHDIDSPVGFDDDVEVVNAVMKFVGRQDLVIQSHP